MQKKAEKKASKKEIQKPVSKNHGKELEARVKDEQEKLIKKKSAAKSEPKSQKKEKELSDKVKQKKPSDGILRAGIGYQKFFEAQQAKLDYSSMFSYLGNLKVQSYDYSSAESEKKGSYSEEGFKSFENVSVYLAEQKMAKLMGSNNDWQYTEKSMAYKWWAAFNRGMSQVLYDLSLT